MMPVYNKLGRVIKYFDDNKKYRTAEYATALSIINMIDKNKLQDAMDTYRKCSLEYNYFNRF
jgi:hypothetical protein